MKPHLRLYCGMWRCSGPRQPVEAAGQRAYFYPFPWGYGSTLFEAHAAWQKLQKRPAKPTLTTTMLYPPSLNQ